ncbi:S-adenosyl methyltransferase [Mycobacterium tuberculosis]|nr:S-adenosyl methyltransferase [Mycobacterium tuberculosis]
MGLNRLIDFDQPATVLMPTILHFTGDEGDPPGNVARFRNVMTPGAAMVVSHVTGDFDADSRVRDVGAACEKGTDQITHVQSRIRHPAV